MIDDPELAGRLRGVASQATIAIRNARLLEGIRHQALHDSLTGLPNRTLILDRVEQMQARARRSGSETRRAVHRPRRLQAGQRHARPRGRRPAAASRSRRGCSTTLREGDTIARLGGDEFVVLVEGATPTGSPELVAERLLEVLREPFEIDDATRPACASPRASASRAATASPPTDLLRDADIALYEAKAAGRDRYVDVPARDADRGRGPAHARARPARRARARRVLPRVPADLRPRVGPRRSASRRCCAGSIPSAASCSPTRSSRCSRRRS